MYKLFYWPMIPGRGEFIRLALEDAGQPYVDVARDPAHGIPALMKMMTGDPTANGFDGPPPLAPPFLQDGRLVLAQVANILHYLGPRLALVPTDEAGRLQVHQAQLTVTDLISEIHDTHHPIATNRYYEEQKAEAAKRAQNFVQHRLPKFMGWFERTLALNAAGAGSHLIGSEHTYVDLSLFHVVEGLRYAFPKAMAAYEPGWPHVLALHARVKARPQLAAYLASPRRLPFSEQGIFRRYPELDFAPEPSRTP